MDQPSETVLWRYVARRDRPGGIRRYAAEKQAAGLAPISVNHTLTPLSAMVTDAVAEGLIASNPVRQPRRARHGASARKVTYLDARRPDPKFLEPTETLALLAARPPIHRDMVLAALTTAAGGVRREVVEQLMGHARRGTTSIYTHLFKNAFDGLEEALDAVFGPQRIGNGRLDRHREPSGIIRRVMNPGSGTGAANPRVVVAPGSPW